MLLDIAEKGDIQQEKCDDMITQLKNNIVWWCEEDLRRLIDRELALKNAEDAMIPFGQEWDDVARENYL